MQNESIDLNNHLFAQLERLGNENLTREELMDEAVRTKSIVDVAMQIIANQVAALKAYDLYDGSFGKRPAPAYFHKELTQIREKAANANETKETVSLLQFRGNKVSKKNNKGTELLGDTQTL